MNDENGAERSTRVRDPDRAEKILAAAARLFAVQGFHAVSLADIGREAGIVGSGIYRHFDNKLAVLVALLDQSLAELMERTDELQAVDLPPEEAMGLLVQHQVDFCIRHRLSVQLYRTEFTALTPDDARRLRRQQRRYIEEWVGTLGEMRPELTAAKARALVHVTIGAIQSIVTHDSGLDTDELTSMLGAVAQRCLTTQLP